MLRGRRDRVQDLDLLVAHLFGGEAPGGLHRDVAEQLQHVVLDQIAQRAGLVVVAGAAADADVLGGGDLHLVDVVAVPQRLEHAVGEAKRQHVLDGLLAEVVVDAEDLGLVEHAQHARVELARLFERGAERLLDDHPHLGFGTAREPGAAQLADDHREEARRGRQVEGAVQPLPGLLVELVQRLAQLGVDAGVVEHARHVPDVLQQPRQHVLVGPAPRERADRLLALGAIVLVRFFFARDPDQMKALGQRALVREVVQRGQQFALREIACGAEDHERGRRDRPALEPGDERVLGSVAVAAGAITADPVQSERILASCAHDRSRGAVGIRVPRIA